MQKCLRDSNRKKVYAEGCGKKIEQKSSGRFINVSENEHGKTLLYITQIYHVIAEGSGLLA